MIEECDESCFLHAQVESNQNQINNIGMVCRFGQKLSHVCQKKMDDSHTSLPFWLTTYSGSMSIKLNGCDMLGVVRGFCGNMLG
jgi:hypothetical protein